MVLNLDSNFFHIFKDDEDVEIVQSFPAMNKIVLTRMSVLILAMIFLIRLSKSKAQLPIKVYSYI